LKNESSREFAIVNSPKVQFIIASDGPINFLAPILIAGRLFLVRETSLKRKSRVSQRK